PSPNPFLTCRLELAPDCKGRRARGAACGTGLSDPSRLPVFFPSGPRVPRQQPTRFSNCHSSGSSIPRPCEAPRPDRGTALGRPHAAARNPPCFSSPSVLTADYARPVLRHSRRLFPVIQCRLPSTFGPASNHGGLTSANLQPPPPAATRETAFI